MTEDTYNRGYNFNWSQDLAKQLRSESAEITRVLSENISSIHHLVEKDSLSIKSSQQIRYL